MDTLCCKTHHGNAAAGVVPSVLLGFVVFRFVLVEAV